MKNLLVFVKTRNHYHDMQDMEFTIEDKHLYMLQTRMVKELLGLL